MTYRGSKIIPVRMPTELVEALVATITRVNKSRTEEPYSPSTFIRAAIREKIAHYARSNKKGKKHETLPCEPEESADPGAEQGPDQTETDMALHG